jgi:hypothetical protein
METRSGGLLNYMEKKSRGLLNYVDIKTYWIDRGLRYKKRPLTHSKIKQLVKDWHDQRTEKELNQAAVELEMKLIEKMIKQYNVEQLGDLPTKKEVGSMRILVCQLGGVASQEVREFKVAATK